MAKRASSFSDTSRPSRIQKLEQKIDGQELESTFTYIDGLEELRKAVQTWASEDYHTEEDDAQEDDAQEAVKDTAHEEFCYADLTERGIPWCRYCGTTKASCFSKGPWKDEAGKTIPRVLCQGHFVKICPPKSLSKSLCKEMVQEVSHFLESLPVEPINPALNKEKDFKESLSKKLEKLLKKKEKQPPDNIVDTYWEWAYQENPERLGRTRMVKWMNAWAKSL